MLSKAQIKNIKSLSIQKYRKELQLFVAEGEKIAAEWLRSDKKIQYIIATEDWAAQNTHLISRHPEAVFYQVTQQILDSISSLKTPNGILLVVPMDERSTPSTTTHEWILALDTIQDPGNMGSIIRIADWFGIKTILCSKDCVDSYHPKVIQSAMGSHLRVQLFSIDLKEYLSTTTMPIVSATLNGENLYQFKPLNAAILLIGNEGNGIQESLLRLTTHKITIPRKGGAESLNAAMATGILCSHLLPH